MAPIAPTVRRMGTAPRLPRLIPDEKFAVFPQHPPGCPPLRVAYLVSQLFVFSRILPSFEESTPPNALQILEFSRHDFARFQLALARHGSRLAHATSDTKVWGIRRVLLAPAHRVIEMRIEKVAVGEENAEMEMRQVCERFQGRRERVLPEFAL
jgi:hypothetical protein